MSGGRPRIVPTQLKPLAIRKKGRPAKSEHLTPAPPPPVPARMSDTVSIDTIVNDCGKDIILSALNLSHNARIQRFIELWRMSPQKSMDDLCLEADIPGDVLIGTAAQLLVKVNANVTKIMMACAHPKVMQTTITQAMKPEQYDERMAFHTMMGLQVKPANQPLVQQTINLAGQGVPSLATAPDPINITPLSEETFDAPQEETVPATLAPALTAAGAGDTA